MQHTTKKISFKKKTMKQNLEKDSFINSNMFYKVAKFTLVFTSQAYSFPSEPIKRNFFGLCREDMICTGCFTPVMYTGFLNRTRDNVILKSEMFDHYTWGRRCEFCNPQCPPREAEHQSGLVTASEYH